MSDENSLLNAQQLLEENEDMIAAIIENLQLGRLNDCISQYTLLQKNLVSMALTLDNYPSEDLDPYEAINTFPDEIMRKDILDELRPPGHTDLPIIPLTPPCAQCAANNFSAEKCRVELEHIYLNSKYSDTEKQEFLKATQVLEVRHRQRNQENSTGRIEDGHKRCYRRWTPYEKYTVCLAIYLCGHNNVKDIADILGDRTTSQVKGYIIKTFTAAEKQALEKGQLPRAPKGYEPPKELLCLPKFLALFPQYSTLAAESCLQSSQLSPRNGAGGWSSLLGIADGFVPSTSTNITSGSNMPPPTGHLSFHSSIGTHSFTYNDSNFEEVDAASVTSSALSSKPKPKPNVQRLVLSELSQNFLAGAKSTSTSSTMMYLGGPIAGHIMGSTLADGSGSSTGQPQPPQLLPSCPKIYPHISTSISNSFVLGMTNPWKNLNTEDLRTCSTGDGVLSSDSVAADAMMSGDQINLGSSGHKRKKITIPKIKISALQPSAVSSSMSSDITLFPMTVTQEEPLLGGDVWESRQDLQAREYGSTHASTTGTSGNLAVTSSSPMEDMQQLLPKTSTTLPPPSSLTSLLSKKSSAKESRRNVIKLVDTPAATRVSGSVAVGEALQSILADRRWNRTSQVDGTSADVTSSVTHTMPGVLTASSTKRGQSDRKKRELAAKNISGGIARTSKSKNKSHLSNNEKGNGGCSAPSNHLMESYSHIIYESDGENNEFNSDGSSGGGGGIDTNGNYGRLSSYNRDKPQQEVDEPYDRFRGLAAVEVTDDNNDSNQSMSLLRLDTSCGSDSFIYTVDNYDSNVGNNSIVVLNDDFSLL